MPNIYFDLTREFNRNRLVAVLSSGQAVVWYRLAIMSKDGDWILREEDSACQQVLAVLAAHGARYRPGAPLDTRWLRAGWSSHFEFTDTRSHRIRCDFVSRPPRLTEAELATLFTRDPGHDLPVIGLPALIAIKRTQRAKDYPVIGALARLLPPAQEIEATTDPDRVLDLAPGHGAESVREAVRLARTGAPRSDIVVALAKENDRLQQADRRRLDRYRAAATPFLAEWQQQRIGDVPLPDAHEQAVRLATRLLPQTLD
ncbi:MAG: hypothetical protein IPK26_04715 [Planctomycetes bacterium]|nr:hypothetical protein [Planctomycetota bacterium]